jgi:hypothetical protein
VGELGGEFLNGGNREQEGRQQPPSEPNPPARRFGRIRLVYISRPPDERRATRKTTAEPEEQA